MYRSEYIVCFRSEISFVPLLFSHRTPFLRPYWQIYFNSTSNHNRGQEGPRIPHVVSYFNSTSNHNLAGFSIAFLRVVSYFNSTSNHNSCGTSGVSETVVSYFNSTSNHNMVSAVAESDLVVSYFNSTSNHNDVSKMITYDPVVSYFNSTSNHNYAIVVVVGKRLFLISILHQTTTSDMRFVDCHSVMWPNERYERRMTGRGSRNDAGFVFQRYFSLKVECTSRARNRYMFAK